MRSRTTHQKNGRPVYEGHGIINEMPEFGGAKKGIRPVIVIDLNKL